MCNFHDNFTRGQTVKPSLLFQFPKMRSPHTAVERIVHTIKFLFYSPFAYAAKHRPRTILICEPLQVISVKVQVINP